MKVFVAGPFYTEGQKDFNTRVKQVIEGKLPHVAVVVPQEIEYKFAKELYERYLKAMIECQIVIGIFDGVIDENVAFACGIARMSSIPLICLRTDLRGLNNQSIIYMACQKYIFGEGWEKDIVNAMLEVWGEVLLCREIV